MKALSRISENFAINFYMTSVCNGKSYNDLAREERKKLKLLPYYIIILRVKATTLQKINKSIDVEGEN